MTAQPLSKCPVKGCPHVGRWPAGHPCPIHQDDYIVPRPPTQAERRGDQADPLPGHGTAIPEHQLRALRRIADPEPTP